MIQPSIKKLWLLTVFLFSLSNPLWALTLDDAKANGLVGEQTDGYVGVVISSTEAESLVTEINNKRKDAYSNIAEKNGITIKKVAELAGKKLIEKLPEGQLYKAPDGTWVKK